MCYVVKCTVREDMMLLGKNYKAYYGRRYEGVLRDDEISSVYAVLVSKVEEGTVASVYTHITSKVTSNNVTLTQSQIIFHTAKNRNFIPSNMAPLHYGLLLSPMSDLDSEVPLYY